MRYPYRVRSVGRTRRRSRWVAGAAVALACFAGSGCSDSKSVSPATQTQQGPQSYFSPSNPLPQGPRTYTIDDEKSTTANDGKSTFSQIEYGLGFTYSAVLSAGTLSIDQRGLRNLSTSVTYTLGDSTASTVATPHDPPLAGFALELAGQAGGLIQPIPGSIVSPMVAATACPSLGTAQTYLFLTLTGSAQSWDATKETAYGTADISTDGSTVNFKNIAQFTLAGGSPSQPSKASKSGLCGPTSYGSLTSVPAQLIVQDPGNNGITPPQASIGIGTNGLLVEDNGAGTGQHLATGALPYENVLGAGNGAIGLPRSSSAVDTGALVAAQYLGFIYAAGIAPPTSGAVYSSHVASFGISGTSPACSSFAGSIPSSATQIYGGDFPADTPSAAADNANCNFAIDLGAESPTNGLYPSVTITVGASYSGNTTGKGYSFQGVAIAGQLQGKNAIFVLGQDATQPWEIYLLQSN